MTLRRVNEGPFDRFRSRFGKIIDPNEVLGRSMFDIPWTHSFPPANVRRNDEAYHIDLLVPGFDKKSLEVLVEHGVLIVRGTKKEEVPSDDATFIQEEFSMESFERRFNIATGHSDNRLEAFLKDGILRIIFYEKRDPILSEFKRIPITIE